MGMLAEYIGISQEAHRKLLESAQNDDFDLDYYYHLRDNSEHRLDLDKNWDVLHYLLAGESMIEYMSTMQPELLEVIGETASEIILGHQIFCEEPVINGTDAESVKTIANYLAELDIEKVISRFSAQACNQADIYPNGWSGAEEDFMRKILESHLISLREFYLEQSNLNQAVIVSIS